jgi:hypothetical protein
MEQQTLFGLPDHIAQPKPKSRSVCGCFISECNCIIIKAIENHLKSGKDLTVLDGIKLFGTVDTRKFISLLRARGMNITDVWCQNGKKRFKRYKFKRA